MPKEQTEQRVWLDYAMYVYRDNPNTAEAELHILEPTAINPINHGPNWFVGDGEAHAEIVARYPGIEHVEWRVFDNEHQHRLSGGTRPRHFFSTPDRERVKASLTPEQLEYVEALEKIAHAAFTSWTLQHARGLSTTEKQRGRAASDVYDSLVVVDFLDTSEEC